MLLKKVMFSYCLTDCPDTDPDPFPEGTLIKSN